MHSKSPKILVTERNANIRELLRREFSTEGIAADVAQDAGELRARLGSSQEYDLVVLDGELPNAGSVSTLTELARLRPELPVVLHAYPGGESEAEGVHNVRRVVEKGGDFDALKRAVREILQHRATAGPADRGA